MEPNNLVVTVLSAKGLNLKNHNKLDAYVSLTLSGSGTWKSKVQTDIKKTTTGDSTWNQRCEFTVNGLDSILTVLVNHKTVLGTTECVGGLEFPVRLYLNQRMPIWFRLCKKSNLTQVSPEKYRGELMLKFEFSYKALSSSTMSINVLHGPSKLETLKRKMHIGKKKDRFSDTASIAGYPQNFQRRSSLCITDSAPSITRSELDSDGLIVPPLQSTMLNPFGSSQGVGPPSMSGHGHGSLSSYSRQTSLASIRQSLNSSPVAISEADEISSIPPPRPRSVASSGFGSTRSTTASLTAHNKASPGPSLEELLTTIEDQRMQLMHKEAKIRDLQEYIGSLLSRIIEKDPSLLEAKPHPSSLY